MTNLAKPGLPALLFLVVLNSCHVQEALDPTPVTPEPETEKALPDLLCAPNVQYGYTGKLSYLPGEKVKVYLQSSAAIDLCKLTISQVNGAEAFAVATPLSVQKVSANEPSINGYGFTVATEFTIPPTLKSGIYLIANRIPLIVKAAEAVDFVVVYPSNTVNAYGNAGGRSLYDKTERPVQVSFDRPLNLQSNILDGLKWFLTLSNYNIGYISDMDMDDYDNIANAKLLVIAGHSEYWTRTARENFDRFVDNGNDALILSGNTMWWQVRYEGRKMICYRDERDPVSDPLLKTLTWNTPSLNYPITASIGADFPRGGYGLQVDMGWDGFQITAPDSPLLEGTELKSGDILSLPSGEYDGAPIVSFTAEGIPVLDNSLHHFTKIELIGFDRGSRFGNPTTGTFIVFKKNLLSGIIVNTATYDWCSANGMGGFAGTRVKQITLNAISKLLRKEPVFSSTNG